MGAGMMCAPGFIATIPAGDRITGGTGEGAILPPRY
ncbi:MAG: hypothetical protein A4E37_01519 [Methanoregulaceae archaeon PtaB.Bin056]|nr:MAG: hypothetical protein A4E37_01519 [Methanoregulaceae archaeon PtaB.Bin056]